MTNTAFYSENLITNNEENCSNAININNVKERLQIMGTVKS